MKIFNLLLLLLPIYTFAQTPPTQDESANVFSCSKESIDTTQKKQTTINTYSSKITQVEVNAIDVIASYDDYDELNKYLRDYSKSSLTDIFSYENSMLVINHFNDNVVLNIDPTLQNIDLLKYSAYIRVLDWHAWYQSEITLSDDYLNILIKAIKKLNSNEVFWEDTEKLKSWRGAILYIADIEKRRGDIWDDAMNILEFRDGHALRTIYSIIRRGLANRDQSMFARLYNDPNFINNLHRSILNENELISTNFISIVGLILQRHETYGEAKTFDVNAYISMINQVTATFEFGSPRHLKIVSALHNLNQYKFEADFSALRDQYRDAQFTNVYSFNDGEIEIHTALEESKVNKLYLALREAKSNFFKLTKDTIAITKDPNKTIKMYVFKSHADYYNLGGMLFGISTSNGGIYIETHGALYTFDRESELLPLDMLLKHEYVHYLDARYNIHGNYGQPEFYDSKTGRSVWWVEGLANYIASADMEDGYYISESSANFINSAAGNYFNLEKSLRNSYSNGGAMYAYSEAAWGYLNTIMPEAIHKMFELVRSNSIEPLWDLVDSIAFDNSLEQGYVEYLSKISHDYQNKLIGDPLLIDYAFSSPEVALDKLVNIINSTNLLEDYSHSVSYTQPYKFLRLSKSMTYTESLDVSIGYINQYLEDATIKFHQNANKFSGFSVITAWVESIEYIGDAIKFNIAFEIPVNGINDGALGLDDELSILKLKLYPNPSTDQINVSGIKSDNKVIIYNILGQMVYNTTSKQDGTLSIDINNYNSGIYVFVVEKDNKRTSIKFIKK